MSTTPASLIDVRWSTTNRHGQLLPFVLGGGVLAVVLAIFGLPPWFLSLHTPIHYMGIMDPLCGMTRASRFMARCEFGEAWRYNSGSFVLAALAVLIVARAVLGRVRGRWLEIPARRPRLFMVLLAVPVALLWINQQLHVNLLR